MPFSYPQKILIRRNRFRCWRLAATLTLLAGSPLVPAQAISTASAAPPPGNTTLSAIDGLRPALHQLAAVMPQLDIAHWKASKGLRSATHDDAASVERDLATTLPGLMEQARASGGALGPSFAVYRNVDALYDVVLRIASLANLAGNPEDAQNLDRARTALESGRSGLGNALLTVATAQDAELARLRAAPVAEKAPEKPSTVIVDDGPAKKTRRKHSK